MDKLKSKRKNKKEENEDEYDKDYYRSGYLGNRVYKIKSNNYIMKPVLPIKEVNDCIKL